LIANDLAMRGSVGQQFARLRLQPFSLKEACFQWQWQTLCSDANKTTKQFEQQTKNKT